MPIPNRALWLASMRRSASAVTRAIRPGSMPSWSAICSLAVRTGSRSGGVVQRCGRLLGKGVRLWGIDITGRRTENEYRNRHRGVGDVGHDDVIRRDRVEPIGDVAAPPNLPVVRYRAE